MTTSTTPQAIREYLTRKRTNVRKSHARIVQYFVPEQGWVHLGLGESYAVTTHAIRSLGHRGITAIAVQFNQPSGLPTVADFSVRECLA